jgi:hypothetical protein
MEFSGDRDRINRVLNFDIGSKHDTPKAVNRNKKKLGPEWYYYDKKIEYRYNELGFRTKPFSQIDWKNSVVVIGCSCVMGVGNTEEDGVCGQLEQILQKPVVNLGVSGSAIDWACRNSLVLHECFPHPKAIVQLWTALARYSDYHSTGWFTPILPQNTRKYCAKHDWEIRSMHYVESDRALWRDKTVYYDATWYKHVASRINVDYYDRTIDFARDLDHPGVKSCRLAAEGIAEKLFYQGLT